VDPEKLLLVGIKPCLLGPGNAGEVWWHTALASPSLPLWLLCRSWAIAVKEVLKKCTVYPCRVVGFIPDYLLQVVSELVSVSKVMFYFIPRMFNQELQGSRNSARTPARIFQELLFLIILRI
jgi:hypothetical protein